MADISRLARFLNGAVRGFDLTSNTLVVSSIKIGAGQTELTQAILDDLVTLQNGSDITSALHHHDNRYFTETELGSNANGAGASLIGIEDATSQFTSTNVEGALDEAMDEAQSASSASSANTADIADLRTTQGTADGATDMGTFTGSTISDAGSVKSGMQELETSLELKANDADVIKKDGSVTFTAAQSMGGFKLTNLGAPVADSDAARKIDVDSAAAGINMKGSVVVASDADIGGVYSAVGGTSGNGAFTGAATSIDGLALGGTERILLRAQTDAKQNGIYVRTGVGAYERAADFDNAPAGEVKGGNLVYTQIGGTNNGQTQFILQGANDAKTINTDDLIWHTFSRLETSTASKGITKNGFNFELADAVENASGIKVLNGAITLEDLGAFSTTDLSEGSNLYFTDTRARTAAVSDTAYAGSWDGVLNIAPSKNAVYDKIESLIGSDIGFTPSTLANWTGSADPGQVDDALDQLASRTQALEDQGGNESVIESFDAGETLTSGFRAVRMAKAAETAGRVYFAERDASVSDDFYVVGLVAATGELAGVSVSVIKAGKFTATAHGYTVGAPIYLNDGGGLTNTPASAADDAIVKLGIARDANTIEVQIQVMGVN